MSGLIRVTRQGAGDELLDTLVELAYETIQRRAMHRRAGRVLADLPNEDRIRSLLVEHRRQRGMQDYELSEQAGR